MRKTALLTGAAGLFLMTAPAIAQEATAPQSPPPATTPAQSPPTLTLTPGMAVRGGDGDLGVLVGSRMHDGSQQLTVQGVDGSVRAVPINGIRQEGDVVVVDFTVEQFAEAETVTQPATPATPAEPGMAPASPATPAAPADPVDEAAAPMPTPPTLPPETPAAPAPGEGAGNNPTDPRS